MKSPYKSALDLTRELLSFNTINPPGNERECAFFVGKTLEDAGFKVDYHEFAKNRTSLVARWNDPNDHPSICFTGHLDVVPLGAQKWKKDPFAGEIENGKIFGRGSSDMKSGIAAIVQAAVQLANSGEPKTGIILVITAGEETGCLGANHLAGISGVLPNVDALVGAEPTSNEPLIGHKGALWLEAVTRGITAHGSTPELGDNAIYKAAKAVTLLEDFQFDVSHPVLGKPTLNVGTISGGININSVPDLARFHIDIRTIPNQNNQAICSQLANYLGQDVNLQILQNENAVATDPQNQWVQDVFQIVQNVTGKTCSLKAAPYFTDASALTQAMGSPPTIILGPGEINMAHKTDEFCYVAKIEECVELFSEIGRNWMEKSSRGVL